MEKLYLFKDEDNTYSIRTIKDTSEDEHFISSKINPINKMYFNENAVRLTYREMEQYYDALLRRVLMYDGLASRLLFLISEIYNLKSKLKNIEYVNENVDNIKEISDKIEERIYPIIEIQGKRFKLKSKNELEIIE